MLNGDETEVNSWQAIAFLNALPVARRLDAFSFAEV